MDARAALWAVRLMFFLNGAGFATWAARTPTIKDQLGLDEAGLAIAFAGMNIGAVVGLQLGKYVTLRFGSRATLVVAMPMLCVMLLGLLLARDLIGLTVAMFSYAIFNSVVDVSMNAHGVAVEKASDRPLLSGMHACFSLGMIGGSLGGAAAERAQIPLAAHFLGVSVLAAAVGLLGTRRLLPSAVDRTVGEHTRTGRGGWRWPTKLYLLGLLAFCVALAEGAANDWTAVYLRDETHASASTAAAGFALFAGSMFAGRLLGDRLILRFGPVRPFLVGTLTAAIGLGAALLIGGTIPALIGFALFGFGISYTLPLAFAATGAVPGIPPARAIANVSAIGYLGFFTGPVLIGAAAHHQTLTLALTIPLLFLVLAATCANTVRTPAPDREHSRSSAKASGTSPSSGPTTT
ncbi:MFS transporter [Nocardia sp. NPDC052566]|uniref:MFS transporter n=1 Tax=Nocardia sp. NPDC052566 TaxID=3364330 RepID=UPI0037C56B0E